MSMKIYCTNIKDDIEEEFLTLSKEEIYESDVYDLDFENIIDKVLEKYDYEYMEYYIREHIDNFEIEEEDKIIEKLSIYIVEEEIPVLKEDLLEENESILEEYIEQKQESFRENLYAI